MFKFSKLTILSILCFPLLGMAANSQVDYRSQLVQKVKTSPRAKETPLIFDIPVAYNKEVSHWIRFFQSSGRRTFKGWIEKSSRYFPMIQDELEKSGLPRDLAYMPMIESGFRYTAKSHANAVGPWQFIESTGARYGLQRNSWLDERMDIRKSTMAAIRYIRDLYSEFRSWHLVAAGYNMGENGLRRIIKRHQTDDFWKLVEKKALPEETRHYVPKIIAAMLIAKAPNLYGFRDLEPLDPIQYQIISAPGGAELDPLADHLGVTRKFMRDLNAELLQGSVPKHVHSHNIRIPYGAVNLAQKYFNQIIVAEVKGMQFLESP